MYSYIILYDKSSRCTSTCIIPFPGFHFTINWWLVEYIANSIEKLSNIFHSFTLFFKVPKNNPLIWQRALVEREINDVCSGQVARAARLSVATGGRNQRRGRGGQIGELHTNFLRRNRSSSLSSTNNLKGKDGELCFPKKWLFWAVSTMKYIYITCQILHIWTIFMDYSSFLLF